jgi:hypothetical protein
LVYPRSVKRGDSARGILLHRLAALAAPVVLVVLVSPGSAQAAPRTDACLDAYESYQQLRDAGDVVGAKRELEICAAGACPAAVRRECIDSLTALEPRIPTVVVVARDAAKHDVADVAVFLDDKPWRPRLDGREIELNPGLHKFRFESVGRPSTVESFLINEREKGRVLEVQLPIAVIPPPPPPPPPPQQQQQQQPKRDVLAPPPLPRQPTTAPVPTLVYVLGGVGGVALGTSVVFGLSGLSARSDANQCRPTCQVSQVDDVNRRFLFADVALGVAVVALAAATWVYLTRPTALPQSASAQR